MKHAFMAMAVLASLMTQVAQAQESGEHAPTTSGSFYSGTVKLDQVNRYIVVPALTRPDQVLMHDFSVATDKVTVDDSLAARMHRRLMARFGKDDDSTQAVLAKSVQTAFYEALAAELKKGNVPTGRAGEGADGKSGVHLLVSGEFVAIDEGNEMKRIMVGLGRGASDIKAHVTISAVVDGQATPVLDFNIDSVSKSMPGSAITSASSLAVGSAENSIGDRKSKAGADAARMGTLVAKQIAGLMKEKKWAYSPAAEASPAAVALNN